MLNACLGLSGEAGETVDYVKKSLFHGHEFDTAKVIDEAGDILWYLALMCDALGTTIEEVMQHNIEKLEKRYPDGFNEARSRERYD